MLELCPISQNEAKEFINKYHRHLKAPLGSIFQIGLMQRGLIVGVIMAGRPVARNANDGWTIEVNRCCVNEGIKNGCSKLYGAAWRAAKALGYKKLITYTLNHEPGSSLLGSGFRVIGQTKGGSWSRKNRPRVDTHPLQCKIKWQKEI